MRRYRVTTSEVERVVSSERTIAVDEKGNERLIGRTDDGRDVVLIVAREDPPVVVTVIVRSRR